jgi:hypothetical protein
MTYHEFLSELGKAGLSVRSFAELVGMNRNSVSNYKGSGEVPHHLAVIVVLLAEMNLNNVPFHKVISKLGTTRKKPRGRATPGRFGGDKQERLDLIES